MTPHLTFCPTRQSCDVDTQSLGSRSAIEISNLTKSYGRRVGVERLSMNVPAGTIYGFLGPNGAGKTTTMRVLMGFMRPTGGYASVLGADCWRDSTTVKRDVGYLSGDVRLYPWMTCNSALRIAAAVRGDRAENGARSQPTCLVGHGRELAERFDLDPGVAVQHMSRGMRQKLGLVLALCHRPKLLILDEPTASLDPIMQSRLYEYLRGCAADGRTVFLSSHTLSEVEQLADRVAILRKGQLVAENALANLRGRAKRSVSIAWKTDAWSEGKNSSLPNLSTSGGPDAQPSVSHVANPSSALPNPSTPASVEWTEQTGRKWHGRLSGSAKELVHWCATQPIEDLSIGEPDLGEIFRSYYS